MLLFDYLCLDCGKSSEVLVTYSDNPPSCCHCNSINIKKLLSAHSSMSGVSKNRVLGAGDTTCYGLASTEAGCAGPGSCCGINRQEV